MCITFYFIVYAMNPESHSTSSNANIFKGMVIPKHKVYPILHFNVNYDNY